MSNRTPRIPVSAPFLIDADLSAVSDAMRSGWISSAGPWLDAFEQRWSAYCGRRHGVAVTSGTTALELAVEALGIGPGDEVIVPTFTIISCALAVIRAGATPVLVDADPRTWCMSADEVAGRVTSRTRAIMPVHIYGHPCDMRSLLATAERHSLAIVEDAAEAHGAECLVPVAGVNEWRRCGSFGAVSAFSFYANKLVTTGEGGMLVTDDDTLAERLRSLRNLGFHAKQRFHHEVLGHQYRMTNLQAALGVPQIERIDALVARKRAIASAYAQRLGGVAALEHQAEEPWARSSCWMYGVVLRDDVAMDAAAFAAALAEYGIETRPFFLGMHEQPALQQLGLFEGERYPVAERLAKRGLYLPSGLGLTEDDIDRVCGAVREVLA